MHFCHMLVALLACLSTAQCFSCPQDTSITYHADVSTGCQEYHICRNSEHSILSCPTGQAFSTETLKCETASNVICNESSHQPHKRSIEEEVHVIDIQNLKTNLNEVYHAIKPVIQDLMLNIAPTVYEKFEGTYLPALRSFKEDALPFFMNKIYPRIEKWIRFSLNIAGKIVEKLYRSFQLSTSSHIAIVSMEDIAKEVSDEIQPLVQLGKYLTSKVMRSEHGRYKRDAERVLVRPKRQADFIMSMMTPFVNDFLKSVTTNLFGNGNSILSQVLLPTIYDVLGDSESRYSVLKISISAKTAFTPLVWRMMQEQVYRTADGAIIQVERAVWNKAYRTFITESWPEIMKLVRKHYKPFMMRMAESQDQVLGTLDRLVKDDYQSAGVLRDHLYTFIQKHKGLFRKSTSTHVYFYSVPEILADLQPIKVSLMKLFVEYLRKSPNSWLNVIFGQNSILQNSLMTPNVYAVPAPFPKPAARPAARQAARPVIFAKKSNYRG